MDFTSFKWSLKDGVYVVVVAKFSPLRTKSESKPTVVHPDLLAWSKLVPTTDWILSARFDLGLIGNMSGSLPPVARVVH